MNAEIDDADLQEASDAEKADVDLGQRWRVTATIRSSKPPGTRASSASRSTPYPPDCWSSVSRRATDASRAAAFP